MRTVAHALIFIVPALLLLGPVHTVTGQVLETDSLALVAFYEASYTWREDTWLNGPVSSWYGVTVTGDRVTRLNLEYHKGSGHIPEELGDLSELEYLNLSTNRLMGEIPDTFGNLVKLTYLDLRGNLLFGMIPLTMVNLIHLNTFLFDRTDLCISHDPDFQAWLQHIIHLSVYDCTTYDCNRQQEIPDNECEALQALYLLTRGQSYWHNDSNWLSGSISSWYGVTVENGHVSRLMLPQNWLWGELPETIGDLVHLDSLDLHGFPYTSQVLVGAIPGSIGNLTGLTYLNLGDTGFTGTIPEEFGNLTELTYLDLNSNCCSPNRLSGTFPASLDKLTKLTRLDLSGHELSGEINSGNWEALTHLNLTGNPLNSPFPEDITQLTDLVYLNLAYTQLRGSIPTSLGNLTHLETINLGRNDLTGEIPESIGDLTNLKTLILNSNRLSGSIPASLGNLKNLTTLDMISNDLTGTLPTELGQMDSLSSLKIAGNRLTGSIPPEIGQLARLTNLYLGGNQLSGTLPPEIGRLGELENLSVGSNQISGVIPSTIGRLSKLTYLRLHNNLLSGEIPSTLGDLSELQVLSLSSNLLSGEVPAELGKLTGLKALLLDDNMLSGTLPSSLINLEDLHTFYFDNTNLCESDNPAFQSWLRSIDDLKSTGCIRDEETYQVTETATITLHQVYPNPVRDPTVIRYDLLEQLPVHLAVYDALGRKVALLVEAVQGPGRYQIPFTTDNLSNGVYFYRLQASTMVESRQMLVLK